MAFTGRSTTSPFSRDAACSAGHVAEMKDVVGAMCGVFITPDERVAYKQISGVITQARRFREWASH